MTYHVNLLLDDERRTAQPPHVGVLLRLGAVLTVVAILSATAMLFASSYDVRSRQEAAEGEWGALKPKHEKLLLLRERLNDMRATVRQIQSLRHTRMPWGAELLRLQQGVPASIQVTSLRVAQFVSTRADAGSTRNYEMTILGKTGVDDAEAEVHKLMGYLSSATFTDRMDAVSVPNGSFRRIPIRAGPTAAILRTEWSFDIVCRYRPRSFE